MPQQLYLKPIKVVCGLSLCSCLLFICGCQQPKTTTLSTQQRAQNVKIAINRFPAMLAPQESSSAHVYRQYPQPQDPPQTVQAMAPSPRKDSQNLAHSAMSQLLQNPNLSDISIQTSSYFGNLLVVSNTQKTAQYREIEQSIMHIKGLRNTFLQTPTANALTTKQRIMDSHTRTLVLQQLSQLAFPTTHLNCIVFAGHVFIQGPLQPGQEQILRDVILDMRGVVSVVLVE